MVILGLSFNTRMLGLAVMTGTGLVDYHIQLRKGAWTPRKREAILTSLQPWCECYSINNVALSIPYEKQISTQTKELLDSVKGLFYQKKIQLSSYSPKALALFYQETKTKKEIMKTIAGQYPELSFHYRKEMSNKNKYYVKLFEAVAVASMHISRLKRKR